MRIENNTFGASKLVTNAILFIKNIAINEEEARLYLDRVATRKSATTYKFLDTTFTVYPRKVVATND